MKATSTITVTVNPARGDRPAKARLALWGVSEAGHYGSLWGHTIVLERAEPGMHSGELLRLVSTAMLDLLREEG